MIQTICRPGPAWQSCLIPLTRHCYTSVGLNDFVYSYEYSQVVHYLEFLHVHIQH